MIGAGLSGICAGVKLAEAGYGYTIFEKNENAGGTWWENVYPGVGVDTPSHFYSFSFALNPDWNQYHPRGADMRDYFLRVVDQFGLRKRIEFETRVLGCEWDEGKQRWRVSVRKQGEDGRIVEASRLNAHGIVNRASFPKIPGSRIPRRRDPHDPLGPGGPARGQAHRPDRNRRFRRPGSRWRSRRRQAGSRSSSAHATGSSTIHRPASPFPTASEIERLETSRHSPRSYRFHASGSRQRPLPEHATRAVLAPPDPLHLGAQRHDAPFTRRVTDEKLADRPRPCSRRWCPQRPSSRSGS